METTNDRLTCKTCKISTRLPEGMTIDWQEVHPWAYTGEWTRSRQTRQWVRCSGCNKVMTGQRIVGRYSDKTECGDKCTSATGPACECKCKGENHGIGAAA